MDESIQSQGDEDGKKKDLSVHFSSATDDWPTPNDFFQSCNLKYGPFTTDVCASKENAKCDKFYTIEDSGLNQKWEGVCWMNPPYGGLIGQWMKKAYDSSLDGATVVCLVPSRTDTRWWHDYAVHGEIEFIKGRLKFGGHKNPAPFPSALVVFKPKRNFKKKVTLEWRDVKDELPDLVTAVLASGDVNGERCVREASRYHDHGDTWYCSESDLCQNVIEMKNVTHWAYLSEPPNA